MRITLTHSLSHALLFLLSSSSFVLLSLGIQLLLAPHMWLIFLVGTLVSTEEHARKVEREMKLKENLTKKIQAMGLWTNKTEMEEGLRQ